MIEIMGYCGAVVTVLIGIIIVAQGIQGINEKDGAGYLMLFGAILAFFVASQMPMRYGREQMVEGMVVFQQPESIQLSDGQLYDISQLSEREYYVGDEVIMIFLPSKSLFHYDRVVSIQILKGAVK